MTATPLRISIALLAPALALTACTTSPPSASPSGAHSASPSAASPATCPAPVSEGLTVGDGTLPAGKHFVFLHHADGQALYVDAAELFENDAATKAARQDGKLPPGGLANPYYLRNSDIVIVRVPIAASASVSVIDGTTLQPRKLTADALARLYCAGVDEDAVSGPLSELPMRLVIADGRVTAAAAVYLA